MENEKINQSPIASEADRWIALYKIGGVSFFVIAGLILFAIIAFFIWPYEPGAASTKEIFELLAQDTIGGLMALDLPMLVIVALNILPVLSLYVALKKMNESYALIALVLGLTTVVLLIFARPLLELVELSNRYTAATELDEKKQYLAAGDALLTLFNGTAWFIQTIFFVTWGLINSLLMLKSPIFSKLTAYVGIIVSALGYAFFIPVIGIPLLFVNTIGGILWYVMIGFALFRALKEQSRISNIR